MLTSTLCHVLTLERPLPPGNPAFRLAKSSVLTFITSSGFEPSSTHTRHAQKPLVISESLSAATLTFPSSSIPTSTQTREVHPITRFESTRPDSAIGSIAAAKSSRRFTRSLGSRSNRNSAASCSSLDGTTSSEVAIAEQEIRGFSLTELERRGRHLKGLSNGSCCLRG
ncbi:hypothetical protein V8G54_015977 [Vigna mungo]|uniref:Uncharacterized protein n=1 Tax=Vigna mungo TaxID=3915 RepID=A0AAQ3RYW7_VIGMU